MLANMNMKTIRCAAPVCKRGRVYVRAEGDGGNSSVKEAMEKKGIEEPVRMPQQTAEQGVPAGNMNPGVPQSISETLLPRVDQLKNKQLSEGTTDFTKIMRFNGPAPELINGRLAMVGFFAAISAEITSHETIFQQFGDAAPQILAFSLLITFASIIPIVRGSAVFDDGGGEGFRPGFNITNELINGRAAMLGVAMLVLYELGAKAPLF